MSIRRSSQNYDPRIVQTVRNLRESQSINQIRKDNKPGTSIEREKPNQLIQQNLNIKMNNTNNHAFYHVLIQFLKIQKKKIIL